MKTLSIVSLTAALGLAALSNSVSAHLTGPSFGRVLHSEPIYEYRHIREPITHCSSAKRRHSHAVVGTAIGSVVGLHHRQSPEGALIGGLIGAGVGHSIDRHQRRHNSHCRTQYHTRTQKILTGYQVTYRYQGQTYNTITQHKPGRRLELFDRNQRPKYKHHANLPRKHGPHHQH